MPTFLLPRPCTRSWELLSSRVRIKQGGEVKKYKVKQAPLPHKQTSEVVKTKPQGREDSTREGQQVEET